MGDSERLEVIGWTANGAVRFLDQTLLPGAVQFREVDTLDGIIEAIERLRVRGAPLIGIAAAMGLAAAARRRREGSTGSGSGSGVGGDGTADLRWLEESAARLEAARPTAVNLKWALDRCRSGGRRFLEGGARAGAGTLDEQLRVEAQAIWDEDAGMCLAIGKFGAERIAPGATVMTHCNAGKLATGGIGTALGGIYQAFEQGKQVSVISCEARPLRQGSRLTAWELSEAGVPCTVIVDSASGSVMAGGKVDLVIVGADRIAANGDVANKVGTYNLATLAHAHGIPFYVAAPHSTFDFSIPSGAGIPIEERSGSEVETAPEAAVYNPAFDVTPARLITAIITDRGIIEPPFGENIARVLAGE